MLDNQMVIVNVKKRQISMVANMDSFQFLSNFSFLLHQLTSFKIAGKSFFQINTLQHQNVNKIIYSRENKKKIIVFAYKSEDTKFICCPNTYFIFSRSFNAYLCTRLLCTVIDSINFSGIKKQKQWRGKFVLNIRK